MAFVDTKYLREIEKGMHSVGLDIAIRICKALKVNRFELFVLAWRNDYFTFVEQWQKAKVNTKTNPNNEVSGNANNSKSLRATSKIKENAKTKRLYGGDNRDIILVNFIRRSEILYYTKVVMNKCKKSSA